MKEYKERQNCIECKELNPKGGHRIRILPLSEKHPVGEEEKEWLAEREGPQVQVEESVNLPGDQTA